jgi:hypothetical protein
MQMSWVRRRIAVKVARPDARMSRNLEEKVGMTRRVRAGTAVRSIEEHAPRHL